MDVPGALRERDREIKFLVRALAYDLLPEDQHQAFRQKLTDIFNNSSERWPQILTPFIGEDKAQKFTDILRQDLT